MGESVCCVHFTTEPFHIINMEMLIVLEGKTVVEMTFKQPMTTKIALDLMTSVISTLSGNAWRNTMGLHFVFNQSFKLLHDAMYQSFGDTNMLFIDEQSPLEMHKAWMAKYGTPSTMPKTVGP